MSDFSHGTPSQLTAAQMYRMNQVTSAGPLDLLLMAYDAALVGCGQRDLARTTAALSVLRNALDFSYNVDIAMGLFRLYQYCAELARNEDYDQVAHLLRELRQTWAQVKAQVEREVAELAPASARPATGAGYPQAGTPAPQPLRAASPQVRDAYPTDAYAGGAAPVHLMATRA